MGWNRIVRKERLDGIVMFADDSNMHSMELFDEIQSVKWIGATWEYVSSVGGGQRGMVGLCAICGCGKLVLHHRPTAN